MVQLFANSGDPHQMPHFAASELGLHCLPITLLGVSRLQGLTHWVKFSVDDTEIIFLIFPEKNGI